MYFLKNILSVIGITHHADKDLTALENKFGAHVSKYGLSFGTTEEYEFRLAQFAQYDAEINAVNAREGNTFEAGHNQFSTWTPAEYKQILGRKQNVANTDVAYEETEDVELPKSVDWRKKGAVNPIQDQGRCGSCWSFASTAAMEGAHAIATGKLLKLSEQELVDCDTQSDGCDGGLEVYAYQYAEKHTMELEKAYPYVGRDGSCKYSQKKGKVGVTTYAQPKPKSVKALKASIAKGPTTVAVDAAASAWQFYNKGILNDYSCGTDLDHAVIAVGYGTENGLDYFIIRNSWTASWGEDGYIRLAADRNGPGVCGVLLDTARPTTN